MAKHHHALPVFVCALLAANLGCSADSSSADSEQPGSSQAGDGASGALAGAGGGSATAGSSTSGGSGGAAQGGTGGVGTAGSNSGGATGSGGKGGTGGSGGSGGKGGAGGGGPLPADPCVAANTCPPGTWVNVTPSDAKVLDFGTGPMVGDPSRPSDLYMAGGGDGVWKSTDYGNTWKQINSTIPYVPMGYVMTVLPGTPPTVLVAGYKVNHKSTDGGVTYKDIPFNFPDSLYSIQIDPYDSKHLISGLHEVDGIVESTDSGDTWNYVGKGGFPSGGISWYVFFVDTGAAATTHDNWFAIAQNGGSAVMTSNAGAQWTIPTGLNGFTHPHGNSQICQNGDTMFVPGTGGPGDGLYKSADRGKSFTKVLGGGLGIAWCTSKNVYTMWGWACSKCNLGASFQVAPMPAGTAFTKPTVPAGLNIGANHIVVTSDGKHNIFVGTMWAAGVWRYVEP